MFFSFYPIFLDCFFFHSYTFEPFPLFFILPIFAEFFQIPHSKTILHLHTDFSGSLSGQVHNLHVLNGFFRDCSLCPHCVNCHNLTFYTDFLQQFWDRCDFITFRIHNFLPEAESTFFALCRDDMIWLSAFPFI